MRYILICFFAFLYSFSIVHSEIKGEMLIVDSINVNVDSLVNQQIRKERAFEKYMDLSNPYSVQGGASYSDYLFVGHDRNAFLDVYDLSKQSYICSIHMQTPEPKSRCHANTINFGNRFYKNGDKFPLLYISSGYSISKKEDRSNVYVYRITSQKVKEDSIVFKSELVQTISVIGSGGWTECITDNKHDALWFRCDRLARRCFLKYPVPDVTQKNVELNPFEISALDTIIIRDFTIMKHCQGVLCLDDNFYIPIGVPSWREEPYLAIINLNKKDYTHIVNLYDIYLCNRFNLRDNTWEPEFFFFYNGDYFMGYRSAVYKLDMELVKKENYFYNINFR